MSRAASVARRVISFGERRIFSPQVADSWLVGLRWIAVGGMLGTTILARELVPGLEPRPIYVLVGGVAVMNWFWRRTVANAARPLVLEQIAADMVTLGAVLWFSGGVTNPFASFLTFQIALAGILVDGRASLRMTSLALVLVGVLYFAPPLPLESALVPVGTLQRLSYLASLAGLGGFVGFSAYLYGQRLAEVRADNERNEQLAMLGRVAGGMAHELNTPLATILLASEELVELAGESDSDEVRQLSRTLASEARRAADLIELLRGRVRTEQGVESVDAAKLLREWVPRELDRLAFDGSRMLALGDAPVVARASAPGLQQIATNLLTNAVQATAGKTDARLEVRLATGAEWVELTVADNGHGIAKEVIRRVGEPFQTTKETQGGTGLGLYVCSVLARRMGARLELESREGHGTRATLSLRRGEAQATEGRGPSQASGEQRSWAESSPLSSSTTTTPSA